MLKKLAVAAIIFSSATGLSTFIAWMTGAGWIMYSILMTAAYAALCWDFAKRETRDDLRF